MRSQIVRPFGYYVELNEAMGGDPLGGCNVTPAGFAVMTKMLKCK